MNDKAMNYKRQRALVTGASSGIGAVFARELASRGSDLVLVARSRDKLAALADELSASHGVAADAVVADLAKPSAADRLADELGGRQIDILVNNAGFGLHARLHQADPTMLTEMVQVNVAALVDLTRLYLPGMLARDRGAVINVASTAAFQPVPYMAVYGASKAFVLSFTEALWAETRAHRRAGDRTVPRIYRNRILHRGRRKRSGRSALGPRACGPRRPPRLGPSDLQRGHRRQQSATDQRPAAGATPIRNAHGRAHDASREIQLARRDDAGMIAVAQNP